VPREPFVLARTREVIHGRDEWITAPFKAFPSLQDAFESHFEHLATSHFYAAARGCLPDVESFCRALTGVYATDPHYGERLIAVIRGSNLTQYDIAGGAGPMPQTTTTPAPAAPGPIQVATMDMIRSVLMGVGTPLLAHGYVTGSQWQAIVGGLLAIGSAVWSYVAAHPGKTNPLAAVQAMVRSGGQRASWNGDVSVLEPLVLELARKALDAEMKARAGLLAGPADALADKAMQTAADTAAAHLRIS
jgi:hypothetical protein